MGSTSFCTRASLSRRVAGIAALGGNLGRERVSFTSAAQTSPRSALHSVASSSKNPFQPLPGHEDSHTRSAPLFGEWATGRETVAEVPLTGRSFGAGTANL